MARTFCKFPPVSSLVNTSNGIRKVWQQEWPYGTGGVGNTSVVEFIAATSETCNDAELSFDNCHQYLDIAFHLACHPADDPLNDTSGSILGGACIAYSVHLFTNYSGTVLPLFVPPITGQWAHEKPTDSKDSPSANLLGFGSPDDYDFGLFAAMDCPLNTGTGAGLGAVVSGAFSSCFRSYYTLYVGRRGDSMNDCRFLHRGPVSLNGDHEVWVEDNFTVDSFHRTASEFTLVPDTMPDYGNFPHNVTDHDTCAANCFLLKGNTTESDSADH